MDGAWLLILVNAMLVSLDPCAIKCSVLAYKPMIHQCALPEASALRQIHVLALQIGKDLNVKYPLALVCLLQARLFVAVEAVV